LTEEERKELLPSGNQAVFDNRIGWARTYLKKSGLIEYPQRGHFQITDRGKSVLEKNPPVINVAFLRQFPEFIEFHSQKTIADPEPPESSDSLSQTPEELVGSGYLKLRKQLESELLGRVKSAPPDFFERLVVRLITAMGYGGSLVDAGKAIGKSGDGGIDGVIKEDKLGLDLIYLQAKRWDNASVGRPEIQKFVGAHHIHVHQRCPRVCGGTGNQGHPHRRSATGGADVRVWRRGTDRKHLRCETHRLRFLRG
jgi:restriction system protein